jgi:hypothetical protein
MLWGAGYDADGEEDSLLRFFYPVIHSSEFIVSRYDEKGLESVTVAGALTPDSDGQTGLSEAGYSATDSSARRADGTT